MKHILTILALMLLLGGCVASPTPSVPESRGILGELSGDIKVGEDLEVVGDASVGDALTVTGAASVGGALNVTGAITGGSFSPSSFSNADDLTANTGNFTTTLKVALTPVARLSGSSIDATSLKVAATAVALQSGSNIDAASLKVALTPVALLSGSTLNETAISVAGTPVALQVGALAGKRIVCGQTAITGTGTLPTTLATPSYIAVTMAQDATGDCSFLSTTNAAATVTVKCWNSALTPAPATTPVVVDWCANGTP